MPVRLRLMLVGSIFLLALASGGVHAQQVPMSQEAQPATLKITVPQANTRLTIDDTPTRQSGRERLFETPPLKGNKTYKYTIVARWEPNNYTKITRTRVVQFQAGEEVILDLSKADRNFPDDIVVRYVPTPQEVVDAMLKLAEVGENDVVYDLGCGDGRIVVTAIREYGAKRGVGIDIDPARIEDSRETVTNNKVGDQVEIRQANVLKVKDYSEASVVTLYMGEAMNLQLRPILLGSLKPGTRIVSHRFTMGDWKPDQSITVTDGLGERYRLHLWRVTQEAKGKFLR